MKKNGWGVFGGGDLGGGRRQVYFFVVCVRFGRVTFLVSGESGPQ